MDRTKANQGELGHDRSGRSLRDEIYPMKPWTHCLNETGPDWYFDAVLTQPAQTLVEAKEFPGYRHYAAIHQKGLIVQTLGCHHWYIDRSHFDQFVCNVVEGAGTCNVWNFACILFEENRLQLRRGYGFGDECHVNTEMDLMRSLLAHPTLQISAWQISAGGQGYSFKTITQGNSKADLATYLNIPLE